MTRHNTDTTSLVAGLLFLAIAGIWALDRGGLLPDHHNWLLPLVLVAVGAIGLLSARPRRRSAPAEPADAAPDDAPDDAPDVTPDRETDHQPR